MNKSVTFALAFMLTFSSVYFIPPYKPDAVTSTSTTIAQSLQPFTGTVFSVSKPPPAGQIGPDLGTNRIRFKQNAIQFFRSTGGNITIGFPSFGGGLTTTALKNTSEVAYHFTGTIAGHAVDVFVHFKNSSNPYNRKVIIAGTISGLVGTLSMTIPLSGISAAICDSAPHNTPLGIVPACTSQCFGSMCFDWSDSASSASYNNSTKTVTFTVGASFFFDPIALDGSAKNACASTATCAITLTTTNSPDVIIVSCNCYTGSTFTISDTSSLTWTSRASVPGGGGYTFIEWYAIASGALSSDVITIGSAGSGSFWGVIGFGVSGANTASPFDSNPSIPDTATDASACPAGKFPCVLNFSTSNANDFIFLIAGDNSAGNTETAGTGFTMIQSTTSRNVAYAEYKIVSVTQSGVTLQFGTSVGGSFFEAIGDAIQQAAAAATEMVTLTISPVGAPNQGVATLTNCNPSVTTIAVDNAQHTFTADASCIITLTTGTAATNARDIFTMSGSPSCAGNSVTTWTTTTAGGTDTKAFTIYHQLRQLAYQATPVGPTVWDAVYNINVRGTQVGAPSGNCSGLITTTSGGGAASSSPLWHDYGLPVTVDSPVGAWSAFPVGSNVFTQTTGGNTNNVNYTIGTGSITVGLMALGIIMAFLVVGLFAFRRRR